MTNAELLAHCQGLQSMIRTLQQTIRKSEPPDVPDTDVEVIKGAGFIKAIHKPTGSEILFVGKPSIPGIRRVMRHLISSL